MRLFPYFLIMFWTVELSLTRIRVPLKRPLREKIDVKKPASSANKQITNVPCTPTSQPTQTGTCVGPTDLFTCNGNPSCTSPDCDVLGEGFFCCYTQDTTITFNSTQTPGATTTPLTLLGNQLVVERCGVPNGDPSIFIAQEGAMAKVEKFNRQAMLTSVFKGSPANHTRRFLAQEKIVGGLEAPNGSLCWQVSVQRLNVPCGFTDFCGGSIIGRRTVLTAAHCVIDDTVADFNFSNSQMTVQTGAITRNIDSETDVYPSVLPCAQSIHVVNAIPHPYYNTYTLDNDLAILILEEDIDFRGNGGCACPICLSTQPPAVGDVCLTSGWGYEVDVNNGGVQPRPDIPLKYVQQAILAPLYNGSCSWVTQFTPPVTDLDKFLCCGGVVGQDSCQGDSGGPVFCYNQTTQTQYLAGITSNGLGCASGLGGLATKVAIYVDWIFSVAPLGDLFINVGK